MAGLAFKQQAKLKTHSPSEDLSAAIREIPRSGFRSNALPLSGGHLKVTGPRIPLVHPKFVEETRLIEGILPSFSLEDRSWKMQSRREQHGVVIMVFSVLEYQFCHPTAMIANIDSSLVDCTPMARSWLAGRH